MTRTLGKGVNPGYRSGSHWATCDRCGFEFRAEELKLEWTGLWVCGDTCFENRHEQDFLRVKEEVIAADEPLRPAQDDNVLEFTTVLSSFGIAGVGRAGVMVAGKGSTPTEKQEVAAGVIPAGSFNPETL